jgi:hypothetical protein
VSGRHSEAKKRYGLSVVCGENNTEVATETKLMSLKGKKGRRTFDGGRNTKMPTINDRFHKVNRPLSQG